MKIDNKTGDAYLSLLNTVHAKNYKGKLGYAISYNRRKILDEIKEYLDLKTNAIMKYGRPSDNGGYVLETTNKEALAAFVNEIKDYMDIEHEINIIKIPVEEVWNELGSIDIENLQFMLSDPE